MIYLILFALQIAAVLATDWASKGRTYLYYGLLIFLFFFAAFRFEVGCDWSGYFNHWTRAEGMSAQDILVGREPLWWGFLAIARAAGAEYLLANVVTSIVFFAGVHHLAKRQSDPFIFLVLLFPVLIINMPMSGIRQALAIGIICFAFTAFVERRLRRFLVLVLLAAGFHSSAAVFLALAPFVTERLTRDRLVLAGVLALPIVVLLLTSSQGDLAYSRYIERDIEAFGALFRVLLLSTTALLFLLVLRRPWRTKYPSDYSLILLTSWAALALLAVLYVSTVVADRFAYYFVPIQALILVRARIIFTKSQGQLLLAVFLLGLMGFLSVWTIESSHFQRCYLPYQNELLGDVVSTKPY